MAADPQRVRALYRRLLGLYPRSFREVVGEAMEQTFHDLYTDRRRQAGRGVAGFVVGAFVETGLGIAHEHLRALQSGATMRAFFARPGVAALLALVLALPYMTLLSLLLLRIEPNLGPLEPLLTDAQPGRPDPGSFVVLGLLALSIVAFFIARAPIARTRRAGGSLLAHPLNLFVAALIALYVALLVIGFAVDQYPCWIGVPNCD